jgi:hypothetical protein
MASEPYRCGHRLRHGLIDLPPVAAFRQTANGGALMARFLFLVACLQDPYGAVLIQRIRGLVRLGFGLGEYGRRGGSLTHRSL